MKEDFLAVDCFVVLLLILPKLTRLKLNKAKKQVKLKDSGILQEQEKALSIQIFTGWFSRNWDFKLHRMNF